MKLLVYSTIVLFVNQFLYSKNYSLSSYLKEVENFNLDIIYYQKQIDIYLNKIPQSYLPQNPFLELEKMHDDSKLNLLIKQSIENPFKIGLYKNFATLNYHKAKYDYLSYKNKILAEAEKTYYDYLFVLKKKEKYVNIFNLVDFLLEISKANYVSSSNLYKIYSLELKKAEISKDIKELELLEKIYFNKLCYFINKNDVSFSTDMPKIVLFEFEKYEYNYFYTKLSFSPEILSLKKEIEMAKINVNISKINYIPHFMIGYKKEFGNFNNIFIFGFEMPLFFKKNQSLIKESEGYFAYLAKKYESLLNEKRYYIRKVIDEIKTNLEIVDYYEKFLLHSSEVKLKTAILDYQNNIMKIEDVIEVIEENININLKYYEYYFSVFKLKSELDNIFGVQYES